MSNANNTSLEQYEVWFLTGSQNLYGERRPAQVADQSQEIADALNASADVPVKVVWKPVLTDSDAIRRTALDANSRRRRDRRDRLDAHVQPGQDVDRGPRRAPQAAAAPAHPGQRRTAVGRHRLRLHEPEPGRARRPRVRLHPDPPRQSRARPSSATCPTPRSSRQVGIWQRAAAGWAAVRTLKLARFGDNMRYVAVTEGDKTEAELRFGVPVNTWCVNELADAVHGAAEADVDTLVAEYERLYDVAPELRAGGARHESLRYSARIELGLRSLPGGQRLGAFTTTFEDLGALRQLPGLAVQRLMADGYGFGAEGDWKTAILVRVANVMGAGLPGGASLMEDYTYDLVPGQEKILGAHMLEVCPSLTAAKPRLEIHPLGIGGKEDPVRLVFDADPGPGVVVALSDMRDRFRLVANVVDVVDLDAAAAQPAGRPVPSGRPSRTSPPPPLPG